ncbi:hypothetical protein [Nocardia sp. GTS18]|uniref:hypothetical protein n=1 Tax=Nocardia sp. GTS18 TaxID=1778064 RepID=UPI0015EF5D49|nr:hypothetical protein [Nocardia sp. GTS18]
MSSILDRSFRPEPVDMRGAARQFVIDQVESTGAATRNDFDIDRIVSTAHDQIGDWDIRSMSGTAFWRIVSCCIRP